MTAAESDATGGSISLARGAPAPGESLGFAVEPPRGAAGMTPLLLVGGALSPLRSGHAFEPRARIGAFGSAEELPMGTILDLEGVAIRTGHHCAQPIHRRFGIESSVRPSLAFYNTCEEIDALAAALWNLKSGWNTGIR